TMGVKPHTIRVKMTIMVHIYPYGDIDIALKNHYTYDVQWKKWHRQCEFIHYNLFFEVNEL
ncbi:MAG: hypothetical protein RR461_08280, partial [Angelakisella sp.]